MDRTEALKTAVGAMKIRRSELNFRMTDERYAHLLDDLRQDVTMYDEAIAVLDPPPEPADHNPCCSSHGVPMSCERYRRTHFVEVRPCCSIDAERLRVDGIPTTPQCTHEDMNCPPGECEDLYKNREDMGR